MTFMSNILPSLSHALSIKEVRKSREKEIPEEIFIEPQELVIKGAYVARVISKNKNVSEADGEHSKEEDMQRENSEKNEEKTMDITMTNVHLGAGDKSMEVANPSDQDTVRPMDSDANKDNSSCEQMDVTKFTEELETRRKRGPLN
jgi:hypothetical protein